MVLLLYNTPVIQYLWHSCNIVEVVLLRYSTCGTLVIQYLWYVCYTVPVGLLLYIKCGTLFGMAHGMEWKLKFEMEIYCLPEKYKYIHACNVRA